MIKTNSILLVCITLFFVIPVNFGYTLEKLSRESASIRKKGLNNPIVGTGQMKCYDNSREILCPKPGQPFYGQDAMHEGNVPSYRDNGDGTVTDRTTGLMWMQKDSGRGMSWEDALEYAENLVYAGYDDWRLPDAKELQYIVDYSRSPDTTDSPAIDPVFASTSIVNEAGKKDYPFFWSSTTHLDGPTPATNAAYVAFGRAIGKMRGKVMDVHGAGAQRSDPKTGSPTSRGPQGDMIRVNNYVRCVRGGSVKIRTNTPSENKSKYPYNVKIYRGVNQEGQRSSKGISRPRFGGRGFVERLDINGDGKISRSEFDGPKDRFDYHDRNNDGYLTEDEAPKGPPPGGDRPPRP